MCKPVIFHSDFLADLHSPTKLAGLTDTANLYVKYSSELFQNTCNKKIDIIVEIIKPLP